VTKAITIAGEVAAGRVLRLAGQHPSRTPGALFAIKAGPACCGRGLTLRDTSGLTFHPEPPLCAAAQAPSEAVQAARERVI